MRGYGLVKLSKLLTHAPATGTLPQWHVVQCSSSRSWGREEGGAHAAWVSQEVSRPLCTSLICTRRPQCCVQPAPGTSVLSLPLPAPFLTSTTPCPGLACCYCRGTQEPDGRRPQGQEGRGHIGQPESPVCAGKGTRGGHLTKLLHGG